MGDECGTCKIKLKRNDTKLQCSGICSKNFHTDCVKIKLEEHHIINSNKNIRWFCDKCHLNFDFMKKLYKDVTEFKETIRDELNSMKDLIQTTSQQTKKVQIEAKKSYADVTGEVMLIKPKSKQECEKTKQIVYKNLNPTELKVGIKQIKDIRDGGILIKCDTKEEIEKIKKEADKKLKDYDIRTPAQKNPRIKIVDINEETNEENILKCIVSQNEFLNHEDKYFKLITLKKMKTKFMAIIECDPLSFEVIIKKEKICVGWSVCRVFEYIPLLRCFKCGVFDHKASDCKNEEQCLKCAKDGHSSKDCVSNQVVCCNCIAVNAKFKLNLKTDHSCFDISCPSYQKKLTMEKRKIKTSNK